MIRFIDFLVIATGFMIVACGGMTLPKKPLVSKTALAGSAGAESEFEIFLRKADLLEGNTAKEEFPALIVTSQIRLMQANNSNEKPFEGGEGGYCVMFSAAASNPFTQADLEGSGIDISNGGLVAHSIANNLKAADCQSVFETGMPTRMKSDFFNVHVSFFSMSID